MYNVFSYDKKEKEKTELLKNNLKEKIYFEKKSTTKKLNFRKNTSYSDK